MGSDGTGRECRCRHIFILFVGFAGLRGLPFFILGFDLLAAVKEALDSARSGGLLVKNVKNRFDRPDHDVQRYAAVLPRLDQRPIQRAQEKILAPAADKGFLDLCEVIVVIQLGSLVSEMLDEASILVKNGGVRDPCQSKQLNVTFPTKK